MIAQNPGEAVPLSEQCWNGWDTIMPRGIPGHDVYRRHICHRREQHKGQCQCKCGQVMGDIHAC